MDKESSVADELGGVRQFLKALELAGHDASNFIFQS